MNRNRRVAECATRRQIREHSWCSPGDPALFPSSIASLESRARLLLRPSLDTNVLRVALMIGAVRSDSGVNVVVDEHRKKRSRGIMFLDPITATGRHGLRLLVWWLRLLLLPKARRGHGRTRRLRFGRIVRCRDDDLLGRFCVDSDRRQGLFVVQVERAVVFALKKFHPIFRGLASSLVHEVLRNRSEVGYQVLCQLQILFQRPDRKREIVPERRQVLHVSVVGRSVFALSRQIAMLFFDKLDELLDDAERDQEESVEIGKGLLGGGGCLA